MVFAVRTRDPEAAARGRGAGAFVLSVVAVVPCGCCVSVTWRVLRDRVRTFRVPFFTGLPAPPWCRFREFVVNSLKRG